MIFKKLLFILTIFIITNSVHSNPKGFEIIPAADHKPLALVIGNASYEYQPLRNTINDAVDITAVLRQIGFEVVLRKNLNKAQMDYAISQFGKRLLQSQAVGLFYFSGHGANINDRNYLLPIDNNRIRRSKHLPYYAIDTHKILDTMENARGNSVNIMILDACRNNPFRSVERSLSRGLTGIDTAGSIISFATALGDTASDVSSHADNGLFTYHLISAFKKAYKTHQPIDDMFTYVSQAVKKESRGQQQPWYHSSLLGKYCIGGCKTDSRQPSNVFQDRLRSGGFGPRMTWIPAGSVVMNNKPIGIGRFAMGVYEVTVSEYLRFVKSTYSHLPEWQKHANVSRVKRYYSKLGAALKGGNYPIVGISWHDAMAYTKWLTQQTGHSYSLATESQWEYAARAGTRSKYWWGNSIGVNKANCLNCGDRFTYTAPVGSFSANPFGLYDILGNVLEWTCSEYQYRYRGKEQTCVNKNRVKRTRLALRGGSWDSKTTKITTTSRAKWSASTRYATVGFRVVRLMK